MKTNDTIDNVKAESHDKKDSPSDQQFRDGSGHDPGNMEDSEVTEMLSKLADSMQQLQRQNESAMSNLESTLDRTIGLGGRADGSGETLGYDAND